MSLSVDVFTDYWIWTAVGERVLVLPEQYSAKERVRTRVQSNNLHNVRYMYCHLDYLFIHKKYENQPVHLILPFMTMKTSSPALKRATTLDIVEPDACNKNSEKIPHQSFLTAWRYRNISHRLYKCCLLIGREMSHTYFPSSACKIYVLSMWERTCSVFITIAG